MTDSIGNLARAIVATPASSTSTPSLPSSSATLSRPALVDEKITETLRRVGYRRWHPDCGYQPLERALAASERDMLEARRRELEEGLGGFPKQERDFVIARISRMFGGFRSMLAKYHDKQVIALVDSVAKFLQERGAPAWAIERACAAIRAGDDGRKFKGPPDDHEILAAVRAQTKDHRQALDDVIAALAAPVQKPSPPRTPRRLPDGRVELLRTIDAAANETRAALDDVARARGHRAHEAAPDARCAPCRPPPLLVPGDVAWRMRLR